MMRSHVVGGDLADLVERLDAGAGHHDADRAQLGVHGVERGVDRRPVGDVDRRGQRGRAAGAQFGGSPRRGVAVLVDDRDGVAVGGQMLGDAETDARRATGDDRDPAHRGVRCRVGDRSSPGSGSVDAGHRSPSWVNGRRVGRRTIAAAAISAPTITTAATITIVESSSAAPSPPGFGSGVAVVGAGSGGSSA